MIMFRRLPIAFALSGALALGACTTAQLQTAVTAAQQDIVTACNDAHTVVGQAQAQLKGGALDTANNIGAYVAGACGSAEGIAAVASSPTGLQWLGQLIGAVKALINPAAPA